MKNYIITIIGVIIALIIGFFIGNYYGDKHHSFATNDGIIGVTAFENQSGEIGYGVTLQQGEVPINIDLHSGNLKVKIKKGNDIIFETETDKFQDVKVNVPENGMYTLTIDGKNATGMIKYPVSTETTTIDIVPEL